MLTSTEQSLAVFAAEIGSIPAMAWGELKHAGASLSVREQVIVRLMGDRFLNEPRQ
jgi:hypothetical protein